MKKMTVVPAVAKVQREQLRVAAYCRVSTNKDDQEHSYETQVRYFSGLYKNSATETLVGIYADEGISGTSLDKRTELNRLLDDCRSGRIDRIITKSVSRFARNTKDCLKCIRELKSLGISIYFEKENIDTARLSDEMMITVMGGLAQEESQSISNNVRWSIQKKMASGTFRHARVPYGYVADEKTGNLVIDPEKAEVVRRIFDMYIHGIGARKIAVTLTDEGIPSPTGIAWNQQTILKILKQEKYKGDTLWQKTYSEFMGEKFKPNIGQAPQFYIEGSHPAIISKETFALAREMKKKSAPKKAQAVQTPFKKKLFCGKCGHTYNYVRSKKRDYWQCGCRSDIASPCDNDILYNDTLERAFTAVCDKLHIHNKEIFGVCLSQLTELHRLQAYGTAEGIEQMKALADLREQKHRLSTLLTKHFITEEKYSQQVSDIDLKINQITRSMNRSSDEKDNTIADIETITELFADYDGTKSAREDILESAVLKITVADGMLTFHLIGGLEFSERTEDYGS